MATSCYHHGYLLKWPSVFIGRKLILTLDKVPFDKRAFGQTGMVVLNQCAYTVWQDSAY